MLYLTTRDHTEVYTAYRTLGEERGADGGYFVPMHLNPLEQSFINSLKERSFGENVAEILNYFFNARMDDWDVDSTIGRFPVRLVPMSHRIVFAEVWHNPDRSYGRIVRNLTGRIRGVQDSADQPTNWGWMALRVAGLFGVFGELAKANLADANHPVDVAVPTGDFSLPMAAWYARKLGLPIANIVCGCNENGGVWDLLHHGELRTDGMPLVTETPEGDVTVAPELERLIYSVAGRGEVKRFLDAWKSGRPYEPGQAIFEDLRRGVYAGVVSSERMDSIIRSVYNTSAYIMDPYSALAYSGLQDYRTRYSENRTALVISERCASCFPEIVSASLGITPEVLVQRLHLD